MTVIEVLEDMLAERRFGDPEKSYVSKLHHKGLDHILKKVGEESTEVVMAAKDAVRSKNNEDVIHEVADLGFIPWSFCRIWTNHPVRCLRSLSDV